MKNELKNSTVLPKTLILFEKEKGGVGATGSLITLAHHHILAGTPVSFIEASITQRDVYNAYGKHHEVKLIDLTLSDAGDMLIDAVVSAPEGAVIMANIPGGSLSALDEVHAVVAYASEHMPELFNTNIIWTMGLDHASKTTLLALLECDLPGPVHLNLPRWHGEEQDYSLVDEELVDRIFASGGDVFVTPAMPKHLYDLFRVHQIATDRMASQANFSFGNRMKLGMWEKAVAAAFEGRF
ncbi:hypothetical protein [Sphingomonas sp. BAUL-RG-20F-R05-02]|uniref:hypothetical protein n=1 Tax=Sphingomonas sp. BAUL-RG-20F-R05-02 TaxID=2914830 RepID=UPI001F59CB63|nr:hypothetical protein [Sphingomonas sp. BAUL-RG-20F-R05-02]